MPPGLSKSGVTPGGGASAGLSSGENVLFVVEAMDKEFWIREYSIPGHGLVVECCLANQSWHGSGCASITYMVGK